MKKLSNNWQNFEKKTGEALLSPSTPILGQNWKHDLARSCFILKYSPLHNQTLPKAVIIWGVLSALTLFSAVIQPTRAVSSANNLKLWLAIDTNVIFRWKWRGPTSKNYQLNPYPLIYTMGRSSTVHTLKPVSFLLNILYFNRDKIVCKY